ncbi:Chorismate synthase chloroplastic [Zea mays]|jgi:hypothetical protein|uniref:Chorismate synthase chloroplastic n=1 Tax=Zea mays TaxID=4577 RepID=A0A1D6PEJ5_MAIZE|nr:Chorismate synthase chloroplastic [Zea mays]
MYLQILSFVSKVHQVVLPEDAVDYGSVTLEQVDGCACMLCHAPSFFHYDTAAMTAPTVI